MRLNLERNQCVEDSTYSFSLCVKESLAQQVLICVFLYFAKIQPTVSPLYGVERAEHLGHALHQDGTMVQDCKEKRAQFIDSSVKIRECFFFAHPAEQIAAVEKYSTAAYLSHIHI